MCTKALQGIRPPDLWKLKCLYVHTELHLTPISSESQDVWVEKDLEEFQHKLSFSHRQGRNRVSVRAQFATLLIRHGGPWVVLCLCVCVCVCVCVVCARSPANLSSSSTGFMSWHSGLLNPVTGTNSTLSEHRFWPLSPPCPALASSLKTPLSASHQQSRSSAEQTAYKHFPGGPKIRSMGRESH
jgi:hypothetical protein